MPKSDITNLYKNQIVWIDRLVAHDTTSHKSNLNLIGDVEEYLKQQNVKYWRAPDETGQKTNLYALIGPEVEGGVVLSGHSDVVPVEGQDWDSDPFKINIRDGKIFGRGTADMKSFSAIALSLIPEMLSADLKKPIILALSYDEEVGCIGAPRMIQRIRDDLPAPSAVIVGEPTMMKVVNGHKGIASFRTQITGFTTHSSQTDRGVSAVENAAKLIVKIAKMREEKKQSTDHNNPFTPPYSTMTVNVANGGTQLNIMAGSASFDWDMRLVPGDNINDLYDEFIEFSKKIENSMKHQADSCEIMTTQLTMAPPLTPLSDNPAANLAKSLTGHNSTEVVPYAAEAGQFQEAGFSTVICGPGSIDQAHQANEFISLQQIAAGTDFQRALIKKLSQ